jgi:hypothetical protein
MRLGRRAALGLLALALGRPGAAFAQLDQLLRGLGGAGRGAGLSDTTIASGLKEALAVGTANAVALTGRTDGYFLNEAIKILMPAQLRRLETGLRTVGFGPQIDEFVLGMNRAAERAAPLAKPIFVDAITAMTFDDARRVLAGGDTAATDYFRAKTTEPLTAAFRPVVGGAMNEVGVTRQYKELVGRFEAIPFMRAEAFDLDGYVTGKGLDGLFLVVADQERQIRTNPAARVTTLLKDVFGR